MLKNVFVCIFFIFFIFAAIVSSGIAKNEIRNANLTAFQNANSDSLNDRSNLQKENTSRILSELFADYLLIKNSLSKNDSSTAQTQALQFLEKVQSRSDTIDKSTVPRNWELFMRYAPEARSRIAASSSLTEQRFFFGILSNYIIELVKSYGMKNKTIYILQCSDKSILGAGKWLSDFNDGKNPFLGPGNENCIKVIESKMY
ncbi:MAG: DUF3347 domain-containing protein [Ignavibacteria bacterium]|nr:DUF3347 domain-containing protein [Ignavibacteria bacterium]